MPASVPYAIELKVLELNGKISQKEACRLLKITEPTIRRICRSHNVTWKWQRRDQSGVNNHNYKNGLGRSTIERTTRLVVITSGKCLYTCERCGNHNKEREQDRHHKDRNRANNTESNIEVLCQTCHMKEHNSQRSRDENGQFLD